MALATLLTSGRYDRHLRRMRAIYAARRATLVDAFTRHAPGVPLTGLAAGFHAVAHLPPHADEPAVIAAARERGVGLYGVTDYRGSARRGGGARAGHGIWQHRRARYRASHCRHRRAAQLTYGW